jgi:hypothetical protein
LEPSQSIGPLIAASRQLYIRLFANDSQGFAAAGLANRAWPIEGKGRINKNVCRTFAHRPQSEFNLSGTELIH